MFNFHMRKMEETDAMRKKKHVKYSLQPISFPSNLL